MFGRQDEYFRRLGGALAHEAARYAESRTIVAFDSWEEPLFGALTPGAGRDQHPDRLELSPGHSPTNREGFETTFKL